MSKKTKAKLRKAGNTASAGLSVAAINANLWDACDNGILSSNDASMMSVQAAIAAGADVNNSQNGVSCLGAAAAHGHHEIVGLLLTAGVDKEAEQPGGFTALIVAADIGDDKCVKLLLTAGADKEAKLPSGFTALIIAAQNGHDKCVEMLLTAGANKEATSQKSSTALIIASQQDRDKFIELLLNAGCDINALNNDGISALLKAVEKEQINCVCTLVRCGADVDMRCQGFSLDDVADQTTIADELKAALRLPAEKRRRCAHCEKTTFAKLQKCSACRKVYYCNRECQVAHWKRHKPACKPVE
jgi:hypothetical protein